MAYTVDDYGQMIADEVRTGAYVDALRRVVRPGSVVVDLGAGTGIFSLVACALGAARVHAIEPNDAVLLLPALAKENGFEDRIVVHHAPSGEVALGERADVIVADLRGILPLEGGHLATIADARRRFLAEGGALVPARDTLLVAPLEAPKLRARLEGPWANRWGVRLDAARAAVLADWHRVERADERMLALAQPWAEVDYRASDGDTCFRGAPRVDVTRAGTLDGLVVGFRAELVDGVAFDTLEADRIYGRAFLPLRRGVPVEAGDALCLDLLATPTRTSYAWSWSVRVERGGVTLHEERQSPVLGGTLRLDGCARRA